MLPLPTGKGTWARCTVAYEPTLLRRRKSRLTGVLNREARTTGAEPKPWTKIKLQCEFSLTAFLLCSEVNGCSSLDHVWRDWIRETCLESHQDRAGTRHRSETCQQAALALVPGEAPPQGHYMEALSYIQRKCSHLVMTKPNYIHKTNPTHSTPWHLTYWFSRF